MIADDRFERVQVTSEAELRAWLFENHGQDEAIWLVTFKKVAGDRYVTHDKVLDQLTAFGWCDGAQRRVDDERVAQLVSPRRTQPWAKSYKDRADRLTAEGQMHPAGQAVVDAAKATGAWDAMNDVDALLVPDDLAAALEAIPPAARHFAAFPPSTRRNILRWIASARTEDTRTKRITRTVADAQHDIRVSSHG